MGKHDDALKGWIWIKMQMFERELGKHVITGQLNDLIIEFKVINIC